MIAWMVSAAAALAAAVNGQPLAAPDWAGAALGADVPVPVAGGPVSTTDLLRLRDMGSLSLAPGGDWLAFSVRQGIAEQNRYVMRWFVLATDGRSPPRAIRQDGGQPIPLRHYGLPTAYIAPESAKWSADGSTLAFRRLIDDRIELWTAQPAAARAVRVCDGSAQVTAFEWRSTGELIYRTGLNHALYERNLAQEANNGWLWDSRVTLFAARMKPAEPSCDIASTDPACQVQSYAWSRNSRRIATPSEAAILPGDDKSHRLRSDGSVVRIEAVDAKASNAARPLQRIAITAPHAASCDVPACIGSYIRDAGWARDGATVWFLKSEDSEGRADGAPGDRTALYEWSPGASDVRKITGGQDLLEDCHVARGRAFCMRETLTRPRHIVSIDLDSGRVAVLADPNPTFGGKAFPKIEEIRIADFDGNPGFAYLIYPNAYVQGKEYPLVVTQYRQRGFLRAQVGAEYPLLPLAATGFAVLSIDRPEEYALRGRLNWRELDRRTVSDDLRGRRRGLDVIEKAVSQLVQRGLADRNRVALTGLSAGAEVTHYALQHSSTFAAAIASSGTHDRSFLALVPEGPDRRRLMEMFDADSVLPGEESALAKLAWSRMPERLATPLLINLGEYEGLLGFEGLQALKHAGAPLEVRIFPDEMHVKYHPRSLAGVYENNLAWLQFWLMGVEDTNPALASRYKRWRAMKDRASPR